MSKRHKKRKKHMQDMKDNKDKQWTGPLASVGDGFGFSTYTGKSCEHTGEVAITIGGFEVRLGGSPKITEKAISEVDLLISLNGYLPSQMRFGQLVQFQYASLPDRGGVPKNWAEFINNTADIIRSGIKVLPYCHGSHGRTGCMAASLIAVMEPEVEDPIAAIRERHCHEAVESEAQARAIFTLKGMELPEKYVEEFKPKVTVWTGNSAGGPTPDFTTGKSKDGKYYHHLMCKCDACKAPVVHGTFKGTYFDTPCECKNENCLWDGKVRPAEGPFRHCKGCLCGFCTDDRFKLETYCQCTYTGCKSKEGGELDLLVKKKKEFLSQTATKAPVVMIGDEKHEWYCTCIPCIKAVCNGYTCSGLTACNCYACVVKDRKWELDLVTKLNHEHGAGNHPEKCACMECLTQAEEEWAQFQAEEAEAEAQMALEDAEEDDTYRYCMEYADDGTECLGDTDLPCKHMIAEDEAMELEAAKAYFSENVHALDCQCQKCWDMEPAYMF